MTNVDKLKQTAALLWLKQQLKRDKTTLRLSIFVGALSGVFIIIQSFLLAILLQRLIIDKTNINSQLIILVSLAFIFILRAINTYITEQINHTLGSSIRQKIRQSVLDKINFIGPAALNGSSAGGFATMIVEQIDDLHEFYAKYQPQKTLSTLIPLMILAVIFPLNWAAALIFLITAPLIPLFMILVGMGAADVNRKNFKALELLSGYFYDRLKGIRTLKFFNQNQNESDKIYHSAELFRKKTMDVLKLAFLSSAVLEFFTAISIAIVAIYFGFLYLGEFNFGHYQLAVSLFSGFFALILAPEFFQPLRDLGTFYHAKAKAVAAAENISAFLNQPRIENKNAANQHITNQFIWGDDLNITSIEAMDCTIVSLDGVAIAGPFSFKLIAPFNLAIMGKSGTGKTSFMNMLLGFLPYVGSFKINQIELNQINIDSWRKQLSWIGQHPYLIAGTLNDNLKLGNSLATESDINHVISQTQLTEYINRLPYGLESDVGEDAIHLSVGQAQRVAIARAFLKSHKILLADEPLASLDDDTANEIQHILDLHQVNRITITHDEAKLTHFDCVLKWTETDAIFLSVDKLE